MLRWVHQLGQHNPAPRKPEQGDTMQNNGPVGPLNDVGTAVSLR